MPKKAVLYYLIIALLIFYGRYCNAQPSCQSITISIPSAPTCSQVTARDWVKLQPGFHFTAQSGNTFKASIDETLSFNADYLTTAPDPDRTPDYTLSVGTIAGGAGVSSEGAANYTIPVICPPGTMGIEPSLSIIYSSQLNNGLLGKGWTIAGLSSINRVQQSYYYDGTVMPVTFTSTDRFVIDGNRLITSGTYGDPDCVYGTEYENFSKITSLGIAGTGPQWFQVETKDSKVMEYGNTADSRIEVPGGSETIFQWRVNKIYDKNGNFMKFYYKEINGESVIEKIEYTGNGSIEPTNTILFCYDIRLDRSISNMGGAGIPQTLILRSILVSCEGDLARKYEFRYVDAVQSRLVEVKETVKGTSTTNSTIIEWNDPSQYLFVSTTYDILAKGDFNGFGKREQVISTANGYTISSEDFSASITESDPMHNEILIDDFSGDGLSDILVCRKVFMGCNGELFMIHLNFVLYTSNGTSFTGPTSFGPSIPYLVEDTHLCESTPPEAIFHFDLFMKSGDFNGDGKSDLIVRSDLDNKTYTIINNTLRLSTGLPASLSSLIIIEFDGDGKDDLFSFEQNYQRIYTYNGTDFQSIHETTLFNICSTVRFGDVNGDGKTDAVYVKYNTIYDREDLAVRLSTGQSWYSSNDLDNFVGGETVKSLIVADLDGNNTADVLVNNYHYPSEHIRVYYFNTNRNNRITLYNTPFTNQEDENFIADDLDDDGKIDIFSKDDQVALSLHPNDFSQYVKSITNGLNNVTAFEYQTSRQPDNSRYPVVNFNGPLTTVKKLFSNASEIQYTYASPKVHKQGKGFLGYGQVTKDNITTGIMQVSYYNHNPLFFNTYLERTQNFKHAGIGNIDLSEINYTTTTYNFPSSKRIFAYPNHIVSQNKLTNNTVTTDNIYDMANGNLTSQTVKYGTDGFVTTTYDWMMAGVSHVENKIQGITTEKKHKDHPSAVTEQASYTYNTSNGRKESQTMNAQSAGKSVTTTYSNFNAFGQPLTIVISPYNLPALSKTNTYDANGRFLISETTPLGLSVFTYDPVYGNIKTSSNPNSQIIYYNYDDYGRRINTSYPNGQIENYSYNWSNPAVCTTDVYYVKKTATGLADQKSYFDKYGHPLRAENKVYGEKLSYSETIYNADLTIQGVSESLFDDEVVRETSYSYGSDGRIASITLPTQNTITYAYPANENTVTTTINAQNFTKKYDAFGLIKEASDPNGTIIYKYHSNGNPKEIQAAGETVTMDYDDCGNQIWIDDPDAGRMDYSYNALGQLTWQKDEKVTLNEKWQWYDNNYRLLKISSDEAGNNVISGYNYLTGGYGKNQIGSVYGPDGTITYSYDQYDRLSEINRQIESNTYNEHYAYDDYGRIRQINYGEDLTLDYTYHPYGYLTKIRANDAVDVWQLTSLKAKERKYLLGNGLETTKSFDNYGFNSSIKTQYSTTTFQHWIHDYNVNTGNLNSRQDLARANKTESFGYDAMDRLDLIKHGTATVCDMTYVSGNGNIGSKSSSINVDYDLGDYSFGETGGGSHAIASVANTGGFVSEEPQGVEYNIFNKTNYLWEGDNPATKKELFFTYGPDFERQKTDYKEGGILKRVHHYAGSCEYDDDKITGDKRKIYYIGTGNELVAMYEIKNDVGNFHYFCTDLLGSIEIVTDQNRAKKMDVSYDAWGNRRDPVSWALIKNPGTYFIDRGYTGHEHIDKMGVINMNGRMYDPAIGMFMSPDNYVQNPGLSINYNRYSYCLNNPLKYTDPSGMNAAPNYKWYGDEQSSSGSESQGQYDYSENTYSPGDGFWNNTPHIANWKANVYSYNYVTGRYQNGLGQTVDMKTAMYGSILSYGGSLASLYSNNNNREYNQIMADIAGFYNDGFGIKIGNTNQGLGLYVSENDNDLGLTYVIASGQRGVNGLSENNFVKYSIEGTAVWAGTIQTGFNAAKKLQPTVTTWVKGAKAFGRTSNYLGGVSIAYDFGTGTANTTTILDGAVLISSAIIFGAVGLAAAPWLAGFGVVYGISSLFFEKPLNNALDISKSINFVQPRK